MLYVKHALTSTNTVNIPVAMALGVDGELTLTDNLEALDKESYIVEKYQVDNPGDVDGDGVDDITEFNALGSKDPLNDAHSISSTDGAIAIPDRAAFEYLSYQGKDVAVEIHLVDLEYVKFYLVDMDTDNPSVYFMNTNIHWSHGLFAKTVGLHDNHPNLSEMMLGLLVYHPNVVAPDGSLGVYRYEFQPWEAFPFKDIAYVYELLASSMPFLENNLMFYPALSPTALALYNQPSEKALYDASRVNVLLQKDILPDVPFVPLNQRSGYGLLRVMERDGRPNPRDIVIYESLPNDLPRVAGIVTTVPQTPLAHVNLRAVQNGIPNAFIRDALDLSAIDDLIDTHVFYEVTADGYTTRAATRAEVDEFYEQTRPSATQTPERDLTVTTIKPLSQVGFNDWKAFGVKAANVAVLGTLEFPDGTVPSGHAVPFHFYDEFMKANDLDDEVTEMLADEDFQDDYAEQEKQLKKLRKKIKKADTPEWIITALKAMHDTYPENTSLRYRSSTNNEDLPGFSGAGLYDSKTHDPDETEEDGIDKSIKAVWASLWNFRAFVERDFHRIDHSKAMMGVLVHPNYSDEKANGVAVSYDTINGDSDVYYVNTQVGEDLVTNPDANSIPEELLLKSDSTYTVLARSNQKEGDNLLMTDAQLTQLRSSLSKIHDKFEKLYDAEDDAQFAMEIELQDNQRQQSGHQAGASVGLPEHAGRSGRDPRRRLAGTCSLRSGWRSYRGRCGLLRTQRDRSGQSDRFDHRGH